ncbi:MAG: amino acid adenylation domain-containing protein [Candidatus Hinthialibacter antarcticus]|nr:amino acid adenylation domain-containing protein [Candidatus Hinthialibacter antarcticus]
MNKQTEDQPTQAEKRKLLAEWLLQKTTQPKRHVLSFGQKALWFLYKNNPASAAYNAAYAVRILSPLSEPIVKQSFQLLVDRHSMLRSIYKMDEGELVQQILPKQEVAFETIDVSNLSDSETDKRVRENYRKPFDLETGPVSRVTLLRRSDRECILLVNVHHIACDGWSMWVLMNEFRQIYPALLKGEAVTLPGLDYQYSDFIDWQNRMVADAEGERLWDYWRNALKGEVPILNLPTDKSHPPMRSFNGASIPFQISGDLTERLHACAKEQGATLYMAMLAAFQVLLFRYTGQEDIIVGSPTSGRTQADFASVVGYCVNPVALRSSFEGDPAFSDFLSQVRHTVLDALTHQDFPLPLIVERLQMNRDPSRTPLFQSMFILQKPPQSDEYLELLTPGEANVHWGGLDLQPYELPQMEGQFDLTLEILEKAEQRDSLFGVFKYNTDVFQKSTIQRMQAHYCVLLEQIVENPNRRVSELPLLPKREKTRILSDWNATRKEYPLHKSLHEWVEEQVNKTPDAIAVEAPQANGAVETLTFRELNAKANQLAHYLRSLNVGRDTPVGICIERSLDMVVGLLGIVKAGGAYVPLDPDYPNDRLRYMLEDAQVPVLLTQQKLLNEHPVFLNLKASPFIVCVDRDLEAIETFDEANPVNQSRPEDLAYIIYTSGSSGRPKGVMNIHKAICNRLLWMQDEYGLDENDRVLQKTPFSFDVSVWEFFWPLMTGARLVMAKPEGHKDSAYLIDLIRARNITTLHFVPSMLKAFLERDEAGTCRCVRRVVCSGEALTPEIQTRFFERFDCELHNLYGPTEAAIDVTYWECKPEPDAVTVPIGRPIANTTIYILDSHKKPTPIGVSGELYIGGVNLARGYYNKSKMTEERFVPDPFDRTPGARLYKTGDVARFRADGVIEYIGRADYQEKIRGFRIELGEVEAVLERHPDVGQAAVITRDDRPGGRYMAAYAVASNGADLDAASLRNFIQKFLPDYMIPSAFVVMDLFPLTPNGKLNRGALPAPDTVQPGDGADAPRSRTEDVIYAAWKQVLQRDEIGLRDNFFEVGGHSLLLGQVHSVLQTHFGDGLTMVELFQYPTIQSLAAYLSRQEQAGEVKRPAKAAVATANQDIAVVGMAGRFPGAKSVSELWNNLLEGKESITFFSRDEMIAAGVDPKLIDRPEYVNAFGSLDGVDQFDASFFGMTAREAEVMDVQHRLFLECAWEALEDAGCNPDAYDGAVGMFAGVGLNTYLLNNLITNPEAAQSAGEFQVLISNDKDYLPTFASYKLNLKGPSVSVQTACSTSLTAVHFACRSLIDGECDMALAGGSSIHLPQRTGYLHKEGMILSPDGHCRPFDQDAQGTVGGDGVGLVALKRLDDAVRDGDVIHAVIAATAINNDGALKAGYTAPSVEGQAKVIEQALVRSGVDPNAIGYIETHGTGTVLGDPIEIQALQNVYKDRMKEGACAIGSVKSNVGHLDAAAGITGFIKAALTVKHGEIAPTLHYQKSNSQIDFQRSPFYVNDARREWKPEKGVRIAAVSSFGIGGTNAHAIIKEAPAQEAAPVERDLYLLPLSAKTRDALDGRAELMRTYFEANANAALGNTGYSLSCGRKAFDHRAFIVAADAQDAAKQLNAERWAQQPASQIKNEAQPVVFLFPGQGTQTLNMGRGLYQRFKPYRKTFDKCCELLQPHLGLNLRDAVFCLEENDAAAARLGQTAMAQPALFAVEYSLAKLWMAWGVEPESMIGHSLGEYVAACLAGVFSLEEALALIAVRGRMMQELPAGRMLAAPLHENECREYLKDGLCLAAVNGERSCVFSGPGEAIEQLKETLSRRNIESRLLHTSHGFHSAAMDAITDAFAKRVSQVERNAPQVPFISNVTGDWISANQAADPQYWARHLRETVRFADGLGVVLKSGGGVLLEAGPGRVLSSYARQHHGFGAGHAAVESMPHAKEKQNEERRILAAVGEAWSAGVALDWQKWYADERCVKTALPTYPFQRQRYWIEAKSRGGLTANAQDERPVKKDDRAEWFYLPSWKETRAAHPPKETSRNYLFFVDSQNDFHTRLVEQCTDGSQIVTVAAGETFACVDEGRYQINAANPADFVALLQSLSEQDYAFDEIVVGWLCGGALSAEQKRERGFYSLISLAQAMGECGLSRPIHLTLLTHAAYSIAGECGGDADLAMAAGAIKTIPLEYPNAQCRSIDILSLDANLKPIIQEMKRPVDERLIVLRGAKRWVEDYQAAPLPTTEAAPFRDGGVYLLTGGLGGVGLAIAERIARSAKVKLALTARSAFPKREQWDAIEKLAASGDATAGIVQRLKLIELHGCEVAVYQADAADETAMRRVVVDVERAMGRINGVLHTAGVASQTIIQRKTPDMMKKVISGKADGAAVLSRIFEPGSLDFFVLFSSIATALEEVGQADYLAANAYLDALAQQRPDAVSINWDAWRESGMAANAQLPEEMKAAHQERLKLGLSDDEGFDALLRVLQNGGGRALISTCDFSSRRQRHSKQYEDAWTKETHASVQPDANYVAPQTQTEATLCEIWQTLFGLPQVGAQDDFFALGGHSLLATQALSRIREAFEAPLSLDDFFSACTVRALAELIDAKTFESAGADDLAEILAEVAKDK